MKLNFREVKNDPVKRGGRIWNKERQKKNERTV